MSAEENGLETEVGRAGGGGSQLVTLWHDRSWDPVRVFRRGDEATVVVEVDRLGQARTGATGQTEWLKATKEPSTAAQ